MSNMLMFVGLPATGKSTARALLPKDVVAISTDDILEEFAKKEGSTYDEVFPNYIKEAEKIAYRNFVNALKAGDKLVIDRTNMSIKSRRRWLQPALDAGYTAEAFVFSFPTNSDQYADWKHRLANRPGKTIDEFVLKSMSRSYQEPTEDEGFTKIHFYNSF